MKAPLSRSAAAASRRKLLGAAPVLAGLAAAPAATAAIIYTPVNGGAGLTIGTSQQVFFDPVTGQVGTSSFPAKRFEFYFYKTDARYPDLVGDGPAGNHVSSYLYAASGLEYAFKLNAGSTINNSSPFLNYGLLSGNSTGQWAGGERGYVGLKLSGNYGWADVEYTLSQQITLYGFAYENTGAAINAGAIPEPAAAGTLGAVLAGSAVAWETRRRRKLKTAA